jgi:hypothetical protein
MVLLLNQTKLPFPEIAIFLAHLDLVMSTKFGKETRYIQYEEWTWIYFFLKQSILFNK